MPLIGLILGGIDVSSKTITLGHAVVKWGLFLQSIIDFTLIAFAIFVVIKFLNSLQAKKEEEPVKKPEEVELLGEIRDILKNRP